MNIRFFRSTMALVVFMMSASFAQASTCPILFIRRMVDVDCNTVCNADEGQRYESLEIIDLYKQLGAAQKAYSDEITPYNTIRCALFRDENNRIDYWERISKIDQKMKELSDNSEATRGAIGEKIMLVSKKMKIIIEEIVKARGAYACIECHAFPCGLDYIDPSSDISYEVYDRLNKEYLKTKNR